MKKGFDTTTVLFENKRREKVLHCLFHQNYSLLLKEMQLV